MNEEKYFNLGKILIKNLYYLWISVCVIGFPKKKAPV